MQLRGLSSTLLRAMKHPSIQYVHITRRTFRYCSLYNIYIYCKLKGMNTKSLFFFSFMWNEKDGNLDE